MGYTATAKPAQYTCIQNTGDNLEEFQALYGDASVTQEDGKVYRVRLPGQNNVVDVPKGHVLVVSADYVGQAMDAETFADAFDIAEEPTPKPEPEPEPAASTIPTAPVYPPTT